ncbi:MAG: S8 family serine peptidase [Chloroflexi bacterium]|nr:S8 family serine peptidase [Chloroflexota bacterium]
MRIKLLVIALLCASLPFPARASASAPQALETNYQQQAEFVPGELIVITKTGSPISGISLPEQAQASTKKRPGLEKLNAAVIKVPVGKEDEYISKLKKLDGVLTVEPNYVVQAALYPNDPFYPTDQYGPALIQAEDAWDITTGSNAVTIAIIDSGVDDTHPEFAGRLVAGYDYIDGELLPDGNPDRDDEYGHGTHVAGIAAAAGNNAAGVAGIAWDVNIMPLRVLNNLGGGSYANVAAAIIRATDNGAQIINLSLGGPGPSVTLQNAVEYAYNHGVAIFAASGNWGTAVFYPAAYPQVMAVGRVDSAAVRAPSSNFGAALDLMAPGDAIYSTTPMYPVTLAVTPQYGTLSGTSMSAPHAAGAAALLASLPCFDTPDKIYQALMDSALDLGSSGWDQYYGYGLIQIADAMALCPATPPTSFAIEYDLVTSENCNPLVQYDWVDASVAPNTVFVVDNEDYRNMPLSIAPDPVFAFQFGGTDYTAVTIHDNGFISLGAGRNTTPPSAGGNYRVNSSLPSSAKPDHFIAPFWDDLTDTSGSANIFVKTIGAFPTRQFVIEYSGVQRAGVAGSLNFEVILFEGSNNIKMQYRSLTGSGADGSSATVGLEYGDLFNGFAGYEYSYNLRGALEDGFALMFIPFNGGDPFLPSHAVCPQMEAVTIESGVDSPCLTTPETFDVNIVVGDLLDRSVLKVQQMTAAPAMPAQFRDLSHYADINLDYSPPAAPLTPQVDVCYEYTANDVLAAGGHPENLFIAAHEIYTNQWQRLPTTVDSFNSLLFARAPHFSYYGVATLNPDAAGGGAGTARGLGLPVTGGPLSPRVVPLPFVLAGAIMVGIWLRRKRRR